MKPFGKFIDCKKSDVYFFSEFRVLESFAILLVLNVSKRRPGKGSRRSALTEIQHVSDTLDYSYLQLAK